MRVTALFSLCFFAKSLSFIDLVILCRVNHLCNLSQAVFIHSGGIDSSQGDSTYSDLFDDELYYNLANFIL